MKRVGKILGWVLGVVLLLPVVLVAVVFVGLNTGPGRSQAESLIASLTGGSVRVTGLGGRFPDRLRLGHVELLDAKGAWLQADGIELDWSPSALLRKQALVHRLAAARFALPRLAEADPAAKPAEPGQPFSLPVRVTVEALDVARAEIGRALLGTDAVLALTGKADVASMQSGTAAVVIQPISHAGRYTLDASLDDETIRATLHAEEPARGLLSSIASLPDLGPIRLDATTAGPRRALATTLSLDAGQLSARAKGDIDLVTNALSVDVTATAPAMTPAPGVGWRAVALEAHVAGPFTAPDASGHLRLDSVAVAGAGLRSLDARLTGNAGRATIRATLEGLRIPGPSPGLLEAAPIEVQATAQLDDPVRPVRFSVAHPLLSAEGVATTGGDPAATVTLRLPDLAPIGGIAGLDLAGRTELTLRTTQTGAATAIEATGTLALTKGPAPGPALIGEEARLALSARLAGNDIVLERLTLDGAALGIAASGSSKPAGLDAVVKVILPELVRAVPTLSGAATLDAHVTGQPSSLAVDATVAGDVGAPGVPRAPLKLVAALTGLPSLPAGRITGEGSFGGAPVQLALVANRGADGTLQATIERAEWRSLHAEGALTLPAGATIPQGRVALRFARLEDLRPLLGQPVSGALTAEAALDPGAVVLDAHVRGAAFQANRVGEATLKARVGDPMGKPSVEATLVASGIDAGGTTGSARVEAKGTQEALALRTTADVVSSGTSAQVVATAMLNTVASQVRLLTMQAVVGTAAVKPETIRLQAPATITYAPAVTIDRLRLGVRQATLDVAGRVSPTLDATVALRTPADIGSVVAPDYAADGSITLDAKLTGTPAQPGGTVRLAATGVRLRSGPGRAVPAANLQATAQLNGGSARVDARLAAGSASLAVNGTAPLGQGALALAATGSLDLALLDPILTAEGRRARGRVALDASIGGTVAAPRLAGSAQLSGGEVQDFAQGFRLTDLVGSARLEGETIRLVSLTGRAGPGTISASGTVGVLAPNLPLDLTLALRNARPLASDQVSADVDADLTLRGAVQTGLAAAGTVTIRRAELRVPRTLPASVVTLNVRRPGDKAPAATAAAAPIALDLTVRAPNAVYLRGRGIDAEMQGTLRIRGTSASPQVGAGWRCGAAASAWRGPR